MEITEITIHPTNEDLVRAYVSIVFDNCFMVGEIRVMQGPTRTLCLISFQEAEGRHPQTACVFSPTMKRE